MTNFFHKQLNQRCSLYRRWHEYPKHRHWHWGIYDTISNPVIIPAGANSRIVSVVATADGETEVDETVIITIIPRIISYNLGCPTTATVTIKDGD